MDYNGNLRGFISPPLVHDDQSSSFNLLYSHDYSHYPGPTGMNTNSEVQQGLVNVGGGGMEKNNMMMMMNNYGSINQEKKKRLTSEQLEALERSFHEDIKLDPDRKSKLSRDLSLHPRQIAVWFQNRRARWKTKHLENLYHSLRQQYDLVSTEKHKLQQEVMKLRAIVREEGNRKQHEEETVESTSMGISSLSKASSQQMIAPTKDNNYVFTADDYNPLTTWPAVYP